MQRPDSDELDGKLKNNLIVSMAFRHSNAINSRITIDSGEAADISITNRGRMFFKLETLMEIQGPNLELEEAKKLLKPLKVDKPQLVEQKEQEQHEEDDIPRLKGD